MTDHIEGRPILIIGDGAGKSDLIRHIALTTHLSIIEVDGLINQIEAAGRQLEKIPLDMLSLIPSTTQVKKNNFERTNYKGYIPCPESKKRGRKR